MDFEQIYILVVDDLVDSADTTVELLSIWGYEAIACYTGISALESAQLRRPSVVILDLAMPLMDGFEFAGMFQELPDCGSVPLLALSGYSSQAYRLRAHEVGIRHYLLKPADPEYLKNLLAREIVITAAPSSPHWSTRRGLAVKSPRPVHEFSVG
jgi:chemosensory pili system protein ChpA (sensor histidine kinase/response regulator)